MELEIRNLTKSYGRKKAVDNLSLSLQEGIYGILGPNGAGKSTLLNILTNNLAKDDGEILLDGVNIREMGGDYLNLLGYMPQDLIYYPKFTAKEFLQYMALLKGLNVNSKEMEKQIEEILLSLHLYDVRNQPIGAFSGGMKRRVLLGQALLGNPKILILDEPTAGLDPRERIAMRNRIAQMSKGRIVLLATHIASDIESIANQVVILKAGQVIATGSPLTLIDHVTPHVRTVYADDKEFTNFANENANCNYVQTRRGLALHVITKEVTESASEEMASLEDVYLYYCETN